MHRHPYTKKKQELHPKKQGCIGVHDFSDRKQKSPPQLNYEAMELTPERQVKIDAAFDILFEAMVEAEQSNSTPP